MKAIRQGIKALGKHPEIGRPVEELLPEFREWVIDFGGGAYIALYYFDGKEVVILAVRHGREADYCYISSITGMISGLLCVCREI